VFEVREVAVYHDTVQTFELCFNDKQLNERFYIIIE